MFSLSTNAQIKWMGLDLSRNDLTFPYVVPFRDNDGFYSIPDAATAHNMYLSAVGTIDAVLTQGTLKKGEIDAAGTKAAARQLAVDYLTTYNCEDLLGHIGP